MNSRELSISINFCSKTLELTQFYNRIDYEVVTSHLELYNVVDNNEKKLKWLSPCPSIHWAGELKRDRSFLFNLESGSELDVTIFNPEGSRGKTLKNLSDTNRLENVSLLYRKVGSIAWKNGRSKEDNEYPVINFISDEVSEDNYGYSTISWFVGGGLVSDGTYEIVVESKCSDVGKSLHASKTKNTMNSLSDKLHPFQRK